MRKGFHRFGSGSEGRGFKGLVRFSGTLDLSNGPFIDRTKMRRGHR